MKVAEIGSKTGGVLHAISMVSRIVSIIILWLILLCWLHRHIQGGKWGSTPLMARVAPLTQRAEGGPPESAPEVSHKLMIRQLAALNESLPRAPGLLSIEWTLSGLAPHGSGLVPLRSGMGPTALDRLLRSDVAHT